jgi:hypothetical protein
LRSPDARPSAHEVNGTVVPSAEMSPARASLVTVAPELLRAGNAIESVAVLESATLMARCADGVAGTSMRR